MKDYAQEIIIIEETYATLQASLQNIKERAEAACDRVAIKEAEKIGRKIAANIVKIPYLKAIDYTAHESLRPEHDALRAKWAEEARPYMEYVKGLESKLRLAVESVQRFRAPILLEFKFEDSNISLYSGYIKFDDRNYRQEIYKEPSLSAVVANNVARNFLAQFGINIPSLDKENQPRRINPVSLEEGEGVRVILDPAHQREAKIVIGDIIYQHGIMVFVQLLALQRTTLFTIKKIMNLSKGAMMRTMGAKAL